jgi:hypothetical protein
VGGRLGQIDKIFFDYASDAMKSAINTVNFRKLSRFKNRTYQTLVNNGSRTAALGDKNVTYELCHATCSPLFVLISRRYYARKRGSGQAQLFL